MLVWIEEPLVLAPLRLSDEDGLRLAAELVATADPEHKRFPSFMLEALQAAPRDGAVLLASQYGRLWLKAGEGEKNGGGV